VLHPQRATNAPVYSPGQLEFNFPLAPAPPLFIVVPNRTGCPFDKGRGVPHQLRVVRLPTTSPSEILPFPFINHRSLPARPPALALNQIPQKFLLPPQVPCGRGPRHISLSAFQEKSFPPEASSRPLPFSVQQESFSFRQPTARPRIAFQRPVPFFFLEYCAHNSLQPTRFSFSVRSPPERHVTPLPSASFLFTRESDQECRFFRSRTSTLQRCPHQRRGLLWVFHSVPGNGCAPLKSEKSVLVATFSQVVDL